MYLEIIRSLFLVMLSLFVGYSLRKPKKTRLTRRELDKEAKRIDDLWFATYGCRRNEK